MSNIPALVPVTRANPAETPRHPHRYGVNPDVVESVARSLDPTAFDDALPNIEARRRLARARAETAVLAVHTDLMSRSPVYREVAPRLAAVLLRAMP